MSIWNDVTGYRKDGPRKQTGWSLRFGSFRISLTTAHIYNRGNWTLSCAPWFNEFDMRLTAEGTTPQRAQEIALDLIRRKLGEACDAINAASPEDDTPAT
jgi:hypothetical protein